ncbi:MAG TPA: class I SAM-dependent methyltransferase [Anaerolineae bacterium]|nr:class I SAM-dependent methyltransferase [Anaerolineae bacterium]
MAEPTRPLCDYEGYDYEGAFWPGRAYEDAVERIALEKILPRSGGRLVEIGAAFGRLADLYDGYERVVLLDPAKSQLREAQERLGEDRRFLFVVGDAYHLPLSTSAFDVALTVRVLHHLTDVPAAFREVHRILRPRGRYVLEYANKRNLKEIIRFVLGRSRRSPFSPEPVEYVPLHFDFHPSYIENQMRAAHLGVERSLAVSSLRLALLKRLVPQPWLIRADGALQGPTACLRLAPSMFLRAQADKAGPESDRLFRCPACGQEELEKEGSSLSCVNCGRDWPIEDGIYDFGM